MGALNALYRKYGDQVAFYVIYIREAHPLDGWRVPANDRQGILVKDPTTLAERRQVASQCVATLGIEIPALVDDLDNSVEAAYAGWPDRIYVVNVDGTVGYKGGPGPRGFRVDELEAYLRQLLPGR